MANHAEELNDREAQIRRVMDQWGVGRDAAALLLTIESGDAFIDDVVFEWTSEPELPGPELGRGADGTELVGSATTAKSGDHLRAAEAPKQSHERRIAAKKSSSAA